MHTLEQLRSGQLAGTTRLDLSCGLTALPEEVYALADTLEVLNLSGNALQSLPDDLSRLRRLKVLFCSDNRFVHLPESIGACAGLHTVGFKANRIRYVDPSALPPGLRALILTDNELAEVPAALGRCTALLKLMLSGNRLAHLPEALAACRDLELLRIAANRFVALPAWLVELPRLAWLACGGNPCTEAHEVAGLPVDWSRLALGPRLGEGASGLIHHALWTLDAVDPEDRPVAVKLFKGRITSDGLPHSEMAACLRAGDHPNLIGALGRVEGHPEGAPGLVMPLVDPSFQVLAGPPSLASCTRDTYPPDLRLPAHAVLRLALGVARAVAHLHGRGILHGDLYAHNLLWDGADGVLVGDFGAAALLPGSAPAARDPWLRLEVLAYAHLLAEMLACGGDEVDEGGLRPVLVDLQRRCADPDPAARPLFAEIVLCLEAMDLAMA